MLSRNIGYPGISFHGVVIHKAVIFIATVVRQKSDGEFFCFLF